MNIELFKISHTDELMILIYLEDDTGFLLAEKSYKNILYLKNAKKYKDNKIENYELMFSNNLQKYILTKIIKGILQFKILTFPCHLFSNLSFSTAEIDIGYKKIKEVYKELINIGLNKELTLKEKIILKLLLR